MELFAENTKLRVQGLSSWRGPGREALVGSRGKALGGGSGAKPLIVPTEVNSVSKSRVAVLESGDAGARHFEDAVG